MEPDPIMERVAAAIALHHGGDHEGARARFAALWEEIGPEGDPFHRCTLAHFMADEQTDPREELRWDLLALEAAESLSDERVKAHHSALVLAEFFPSLHLNLAEDYRKLGDPVRARGHLVQAQQRLDALPENGYGAMIKMGIQRLAEQLGST